MSTESHHTKSKQDHEHGTTRSYVIGFILSLVFTFIPYYLVTEHVMSGNSLTFTILGIAVLQMAIQMYFFLHLGRGPKPLYNVIFFFATAGIIVLTIGASLFIMANLYHNMTPDEVTTRVSQEENIAQVGGQETGACQVSNESYIVTIKDGQFNPVQFSAERCGSLTFVSEDGKSHEIVFGEYPNTESYGGLFEVKVGPREPETITLNQTGTFTFRDSLNPDIVGKFIVE